MKLKSIIAASLLTISASAMAQYDLNASVAEHATEVQESIDRLNGNGKHNLAPEPFKDFLAKFSSDPQFMDSRISLSTADKEKNASLLVPETFSAKAPQIMLNEGVEDVYYQIWDEMQFHTVHLNCCWDGILDHDIVFERKNGKWYLTQINY